MSLQRDIATGDGSPAELKAAFDARTRELEEAREREAATSEVLKIISSSPGALTPVFEAILTHATRLCEARFGTLFLREGDAFRVGAQHNTPKALADLLQSGPLRPGDSTATGRAAKTKKIVHIADYRAEQQANAEQDPMRSRLIELGDVRSILAVPMLKGDELVGVITIFRQELNPFSDKQIALVSSFAAQAVIAIENARLFSELRESLEQQTATSEVLKIISSSPGELAPVFDAMLKNATEICEAKFGQMLLYEDGQVQLVAQRNVPEALVAWDKKMGCHRPVPGGPLERLIRDKLDVLHISDVTAEKSSAPSARLGGARTLLTVPMRKDGMLIGAIIIYRQEVRPFSEKQIELLSNFAAQAVIAIENTRLLNELRQRTDDLTESLEQQTATSEVLQVISSSPGELEPVFQAMLANAVRICEGKFGTMFKYADGEFRALSALGNPPAFLIEHPHIVSEHPDNPLTRIVASKEPLHISDLTTDRTFIKRNPRIVALVESAGARSLLVVPMLKEGELTGALVIYRQEVRPFTDKQIELVQNFAAQAVIAIENTRLLSELRQRTDDLTESLAQQTATSEVLKVISSSPGDLEPVFKAMLENATRICGAKIGILWGFGDGAFGAVAMRGVTPQYAAYLNQGPIRPGPTTGLGRLISTWQTIHIVDTLAEQAYADRDPFRVATAELGGARSLLNVPMIKDGELVGAIGIYRQEVRPFTDKQIELITNFAAQAVIAIENTRLLNELRQRTDDLTESLEQQTATSEVLKVISSSPGELEPVFRAMLENATNLCGAKFGTLNLYEGGKFRTAALHNAPSEFAGRLGEAWRPHPKSGLARVAATKQVVHIGDLRTQPAYLEGDPAVVGLSDVAGARTLLLVPMLKDDELIGNISIYRQEVRPFSDKQIELVKNFAAQAVIALENTRLLNELRQRTDDLTESLEQQTATSEVLKVISSSSGELQPVFESLLANATRLCAAKFGNLYLCEGDAFRTTAMHNVPPAFAEMRMREPLVHPEPGSLLRRLFDARKTIQVKDATKEQAYVDRLPMYVSAVEIGGFRSMIAVPMLKDSNLIGAIIIYRPEVEEFSRKQIELVQNFAAQAVIAIENARLLSELRETLERQTATSEVLSVISSSPGELEPVFNAMLENATRICEAKLGTLFLLEGSSFRAVAVHGDSYYADLTRRDPIVDMRDKVNRGVPLDRVFQSKSILHIHDLCADEGYIGGNERIKALVESAGARSHLVVPMLKEGELVGAVVIYRQEVRPFSDKQVELIQNFASQAVIAIENARLLNELRESLEQQTATSEVLKVIASSSGELAPVFGALLANATQLCDASYGALWLREGDAFRTAALHGDLPQAYLDQWRSGTLFRPSPDVPLARVAATGQPAQIADLRASEAYRSGDRLAVTGVDAGGIRTVLSVPMFRDKELVGVIAIYRKEVRPFADKQIDLVKNFGAQAVIAIENARLLNELRQRTDDLTESLQQQTASGEVLASISGSMTDTNPVFDTIVRNLLRLFGTRFAVVQVLREGMIYMPAVDGDPGFEKMIEYYPRPLDDSTGGGVAMLTRQVVQYASIIDNPAAPATMRQFSREFGFDATIFAPMIRNDRVIGVIGVARREPKPFSDKHVALIKAFADQAVIAIENTRLFNELRQRTDDLTESLQQQTATSDILEVISNSPTDSQPAFDAIVRSGLKLFPEAVVAISLPEGDLVKLAAIAGADAADLETLRARYPLPQSREFITATAILERREMDFADAREAPEHLMPGRQNFLASGYRAMTVMPMMRGEAAIGAISVIHRRPRQLSDKQRELLRTFASQAVIAIENTRLFSELRQRTDALTVALEQQTATADVLSVMSRSKFDLEPILQSVVDTASRLCRAEQAGIFRLDQGVYRFAAAHSLDAKYLEFEKATPYVAGPGTVIGRAAMTREVARVDDVLADPLYEQKDEAGAANIRSAIGVPLMREGEAIGVIALARGRVEPFTDREIELVTTFADQAVIAIENVRLFDEVQARTEDLQESLQQQTATADVLKVISRSTFDLPTVLNTLLESAVRLCRADRGAIRLARDGEYHTFSLHGYPPEHVEYMKSHPVTPARSSVAGRVALEGKAIHVADVVSDPELTMLQAPGVSRVGTVLGVPLLREGTPIGILIMSRTQVEPFSDKQVQLVNTFADQAVIAIENVRLFDEVQKRTEDLAESLQQQTATADVLKVISRSTFDLQTVLDTLSESVAKLCDAYDVVLFLRQGDKLKAKAHYGPIEIDFADQDIDPRWITGRSFIDAIPVRVDDASINDEFPRSRDRALRMGHRTILAAPLLRDGESIGVITMRRMEPRPFTDKQTELVQTFADQAVIAIENVRLFDEVQARTDDLTESLQQQTATADVLKVISRSTFDLGKVLQTLVESAARLSDADKANITREKNGVFYRAEAYGYSREFMDYVKEIPIKAERGSGFGRALLEGQVVHIPDVKADPEYTLVDAQRLGDYRTVLAVPMLREGVPIGVLTLTRSEVRPFTDKQIALVSTFADQAAIAIENVRLFDEIQEKSRQLEEASKHKSQFLANMSHELRTPLNAILGYTELIADGVYGETPEKVQATVQRIITNGRHLLGLINDVLDLSKIEAGQLTLSLADYSMKDVVHSVYGAVEPLAAEKKLTFKAEIAPDMSAGLGDERRLTQVLLNLVGNAIKFTDTGEVMIKASQSNGAFSVAVCDTGPGISEDDQKKLFQEFQQADSSTTKKKGGTGLGLAISKKIVEMHGGRIWLESQVGKGSTFAFTVPTRAEQQKRQA